MADLVLEELVVVGVLLVAHLLDLAHHLHRLTGGICTIVDDLAVVVHDGVHHLALGPKAVVAVPETIKGCDDVLAFETD